jgi:septum formation protein
VTDHASTLVLGSASPRRREILTTLGIPFVVAPAEVDEKVHTGEHPFAYLERIVLAKLGGVPRLEPEPAGGSLILVADTIVVYGGAILGKPVSKEDAAAMLTRLSGHTHEVHTRFALGSRRGPAETELQHAELVTTKVTFRALDPEEIARYVETGEGVDKAGAYAIQGIGSFAVSRLDGSYGNVVGLPACELVLALRRIGFLDRFPR